MIAQSTIGRQSISLLHSFIKKLISFKSVIDSDKRSDKGNNLFEQNKTKQNKTKNNQSQSQQKGGGESLLRTLNKKN